MPLTLCSAPLQPGEGERKASGKKMARGWNLATIPLTNSSPNARRLSRRETVLHGKPATPDHTGPSDSPWLRAAIPAMIAAPHTVIDAADEAGVNLLASLKRAAGALAPGQVMEVISRDGASDGSICEWCGSTGNTLIDSITAGANRLYWIRKV